MDIKTLAAPLTALVKGDAKPTLTLSLPLPAALTAQPTGKALDLTIISTSGNQTTLALPNGTQFTATLNPPLPPGSRLQLTLPPSFKPTPTPQPLPAGTPAPQQPAMQPLPLKLISVPQTPQTQSTAQQPQQQVILPQLTLTYPSTLVPQTTPATPPQTTAQPAPALPAGPVLLTVTNPQSSAPLPVPGQPVAVIVSGPQKPDGSQPVTLPAPTPIPGGKPSPQPQLSVSTGTPLPVGTRLTLMPLAPRQTPQTPSQPTTPAAPPTLTALLLQPTPLPVTQAAAPVQSQPLPEAHTLRLVPQPGTALPAPAPHALPTSALILPARVLTPPTPAPGGAMQQQTVLLPTGAQMVVESPTGLERGSVLTVHFTPTGPQVLTAQTPTPPAAPLPTAPGTPAPLTLQQLTTTPPPATILTGQVTAQQTPVGQQPQLTLTISTPGPWQGQQLLLTSPQPLPVGSTLTLHLSPQGQATVIAAQVPEAYSLTQTHTSTLGTLTQTWPALRQLMNLLPTLLPGLAQNLAQKIPQLQAFAPTFLPYADAIAQASPERAFGADVAAFARALGLDLSSDIQQLSQLQTPQTQPGQQPTEPWRGILFPYQENPQADPRQGSFFWRRQQSETEPEKSSTRFVVELALTQFGALQLDGLLSYPSLWLKLRLHNAPTPEQVQELQSLVALTLKNVGLEGGIAVEQTHTFPINPVAEFLSSTGTAPASAHTTVV